MLRGALSEMIQDAIQRYDGPLYPKDVERERLLRYKRGQESVRGPLRIAYLAEAQRKREADEEQAKRRQEADIRRDYHVAVWKAAQALCRGIRQALNTNNISDIQRETARAYNISVSELLAKRRTVSIVFPRQVAMYLCKHLTPHSLPNIGHRFGGKDHTTVIHAVRRIAAAIADDPELAERIDAIKREITATR